MEYIPILQDYMSTIKICFSYFFFFYIINLEILFFTTNNSNYEIILLNVYK